MATEQKSGQDDASITCEICEKYFEDPRVLPCLHTYCFQCIRKKASPFTGDFRCPMEDGTIIKRNKIDLLPKDDDMCETIESFSNLNIQNDPNDSDDTGSTISETDINERNAIFISGLPRDMPKQHMVDVLDETFKSCGTIKPYRETNKPSIYVHPNRIDKSKLLGTATITFENGESAAKAIQKFHGQVIQTLNNAKIFVQEADPSRVPGAGPQEQTDRQQTDWRSREQTDRKQTDWRSRGQTDNGLKLFASKDTLMPIWVQDEEGQLMKLMLYQTSVISDLITTVHDKPNDDNSYRAYYQNQQLKLNERIPSNTTAKQPIIFKKILKPQPLSDLRKQNDNKPEEYHIVVDNSNLFIGAQNIFDEKTRSFRTNQNIRIKTKDLVRIVLERRKFRIHIRTRIVGGATVPGNTRVWEEWRECGYECRNQERPNGGPEQLVDDMLHGQILNLLLDYDTRERDRQQVLILVTGDGNVNRRGASFPIVVERALEKGWHVQLWSWKSSLNRTFFNIQEMRPDEFTINYLDEHRNEITFEERKQN